MSSVDSGTLTSSSVGTEVYSNSSFEDEDCLWARKPVPATVLQSSNFGEDPFKLPPRSLSAYDVNALNL